MAGDQQKKLGPLAIAMVPVLAVGLMFGVVLIGGAADNCNPEGGTVTVDPASVPEDLNIGGYGHEQLVNAAHIITAGEDSQLSVRDQTIGVMTAMGESSLKVIGYGDAVGPDNRGLFQQRDNWGPIADRMDAYKSATMFFTAMVAAVPEAERVSLAPTIVAHRTQINADPYHYEKYWDTAVQIVDQLSGTTTGLKGGSGGAVCNAEGTTPGSVGKDGWASPANGPINSGYGNRGGPYPNHTGIDLNADGCGGPIWSSHDGTVSNVFVDSLSNHVVDVDHGGGTVTRYVHMYPQDILVTIGQKVKAGDQIARAGASGAAFGCHLHYEVLIDGTFVDPQTFLAERGITY